MTRRRHIIIFWGVIGACLVLGLGRYLLAPALRTVAGDIVINEFVASNGLGLVDEDGDSSDWIELYNRGTQPVNLSGWSLTDDPTLPEKWVFPDVTLAANDYLLVFASGKNRHETRSGSALHTNFKLNSDGDFLGLYRILDQHFVDVIEPQYPPQWRDIAYGRYENNDALVYLDPPTPGRSNAEAHAWAGRVEPILFSVSRGFFDSPFTVTLTTTTTGAAIRYTLDGSDPTLESGLAYTGPITIATTAFLQASAEKPGMLPAANETQTYLFLDDVVRQPPNPPGFPAGADYEMDARVVDDPRYSQSIAEALQAIPTISLVSDAKNLDIYQNSEERGVLWERPISVEFIDPAAEHRNFQVNAGIRIQGGVGRLRVYPKHSFRLFFKRDYGSTKLEQPFFPDSPVEAFDTLVLRGGVNRTFAGYPELGDRPEDLRLSTYARDEWLRASQIAMSGVGSHGLFAHLYLNGLYWGLYNVVERPDAAFAAAYFGGERDDWGVVNHSGPVSGNTERFDQLHALARAGGLADPDKYAAVTKLLDVEQFADYLILNFYSGNTDWGHNNWYALVHNPDGRVKYFAWDGEKTWFDGADIYLGEDKYGGQRNRLKRLVPALMENPDFRMMLADRMYRHLFNAGALTEANAQARWLDITQPLEQAIIGESARWGDAVFDPPLMQEDWRIARQDVLNQMDGNVAQLIDRARQTGYYPTLDPPIFNPPGGLVAPNSEVALNFPAAGQGEIYYTLDGTDPRQAVTGAVSPSVIRYAAPLVLTTTTRIRARLLADGQWSALAETAFRVADQPNPLQFTEIMYNPPEGGDYEFLELKNNGSAAIDLANASFEGIRYTFPPNTPLLLPGQFMVLARNAAAFAEKYPAAPLFGTYQGQLSNDGEAIVLHDFRGEVIYAVTYDDDHGWPVSPDGRGDSLVLVDLEGDPNAPHSWRASTNLGGSPGEDDPQTLLANWNR
ncbi:MAG: lamin tail domain-containing protein [Anaerolineae bacterium]|nr:lamin tail domain-containing protein [Anaerolineae bacterium]